MPYYLDPKTDVTFKKIFGEHPEILKHFLNAVLPLKKDRKIINLEYLHPEQAPIITGLKRPIIDVKCKDQYNRTFIVEMQIEWSDALLRSY